jgi:dTDP-4-dehydrorhamnose reductase
MKRLGKKEKSIKVIHDQIGSPTNARDLALAILSIIQSDKFKSNALKKEIFHFSNSGECSWFDLATKIFSLTGIDCKTIQISAKEYGSSVERPKYSALDCSKIALTFGIKLREWQYSLEKCINGA